MRKLFLAELFCLLILPLTIQAQTDTITVDEVVVTASRSPIFYKEAARIMTVLTADEIRKLPVQSLNELLETALGVDARQRGIHGVQADISIRAGNFEQTLVLLNGVKIHDPQTGHHAMNLPVELSQIERIEILQGPGARVFGANAFGGVINIITSAPSQNQAKAHFSAGQFGLINSGLQLTAKTGNLRSTVAYNHKSSNGYIENTDFNTNNLFLQGNYNQGRFQTTITAGYTEKEFGAQAFYTPKFPNQFEAIRVKFVSGETSYGEATKITLRGSFRRHHDRFELFRDSAPAWYRGHNYHMSDVYAVESNLTHRWKDFSTSLGVEFRNESILSNVLGKEMENPRNVPGEPDGKFTKSDQRNIGAIFVEQTYRNQRLLISGGALFNYYSDFSNKTFAGLDASYKFTENVTVFASANQSLRLPSYTELYYQGPTNISNPDLKPEEAITAEGGLKYFSTGISASAAVFHRWGKNLIDWVKFSATDEKWQTANLTDINTIGVELSVRADLKQLLRISRSSSLTMNYAWNSSTKNDTDIISYYVLDYLKHNLSISLSGQVYKQLNLTVQGNYRHRAGSYTAWDFDTNMAIGEEKYTPFTTLDLRLDYRLKNIELFGQINNLTNVTVMDFGNIPQPGRWMQAGIRVKIGKDA